MFVPAGKVLMTEWSPDFSTVQHDGLDDTIKYFKPDFGNDKSFSYLHVGLFKLVLSVHLCHVGTP